MTTRTFVKCSVWILMSAKSIFKTVQARTVGMCLNDPVESVRVNQILVLLIAWIWASYAKIQQFLRLPYLDVWHCHVRHRDSHAWLYWTAQNEPDYYSIISVEFFSFYLVDRQRNTDGGFTDNNCLTVIFCHTALLMWSEHNSFHTQPVDRLSAWRGDHFIPLII